MRSRSVSQTPWTVARQAPLSMGFSRQEYWSGLPCPSPGLQSLINPYNLQWGSLVAQMVKNLPAMQETQETWVQSLGQEVALEEGMATHSRILAWRTPWTEEPGGLQFVGSQRVGHDRSNLACMHPNTKEKVF